MQTLSQLFSAWQSTLLWAFGSTVLLGLLLVLTKNWHGRLSMDFTDGVQKFHTAPTPRIGGVPVVLGLWLTWAWGWVGQFPVLSTHAELMELLRLLLLAGMPAFVFGLLEDVSKRVSVLMRLLATMASGVLGWWLTGYVLTGVDVWGVDVLFAWTPFAVLFTAFAVGGVANAFNIIDGFNGLASSTAFYAFVGFGLMAWQVGDVPLLLCCWILAAAVLGFFVINWPWGKLFLGDGGSYFIGFALGWVAVLLLGRHADISAFAVVVMVVHPVTEVLFSIYRRRVRHQSPGAPDRLHFHSLFKRRYVARWLKRQSGTVRNSVAGVLVGSLNLFAIPVALLTQFSVWASSVALVLLMLGYVMLYGRMVVHRWVSPWRFMRW